jgi:hypothetical protein
MDEVLQLYFVDDEEMKVVGVKCVCTNAEHGMFWIEAKRATASFGTLLFLTEKEANQKALEVFRSKAAQYNTLYQKFAKAAQTCNDFLNAE